MAKVSNLKLKLQTNTSNTYFATWSFNSTAANNTTTSSTTFRAGDTVRIKSGAKYYNGVSIPSWVMNDTWILMEVKGTRAVLGKNTSGTHNICSPIHTSYLTKNGSSSGSSTVSRSTLDHYKVSWYYATGDGIWFVGGSSDVKEDQATYSPPENAIRIKVAVLPVAKTHKVNDKDVSYWSGTTVQESVYVTEVNPATPSKPTVTIDKYNVFSDQVGNYKLTASLIDISDPRCEKMEFWVYSGNTKKYAGTVNVTNARASYSVTVAVGFDYRVKCRAINMYGSTALYSGWSDFSASVKTAPATPNKDVSVRALSSTSVYLDWQGVSNATKYNIQYTKKKAYFDSNTTEVHSVTLDATDGWSHAEITGLETGTEWFFRLNAENEQGTSYWSDIVSVVIGKKPGPPTTWSSTTTAITGEPLTLYWAHNAEDGSSQTYADLELIFKLNNDDPGTKETYTIKNENIDDEDKKDKTLSYSIDTSKYPEGTKIEWRVRTAGATKEYGEWSIKRTIDIYAKPTLALSMTDVDGTSIETLVSFPFYISALAGPNTQAPIGYHLSIVSNETYETVDYIGNPKIVTNGETLYSNYFDITEPLLVEMLPSNVDLENGINYSINCSVSMNSGLTAEDSLSFTVSWTDDYYEPDAEIGIDTDSYSATIAPFCKDDKGVLIDNVLLAVYRREFDGSFTEIEKNIENNMSTTVIDPHPSLDYARYRIVVTSKTTGAVSFYDAPGYPINCESVIVQWDEEWTNFDPSVEDELQEPPWVGSLLQIPYNIDVSDSNSPDVSLIKYIGREYPVGYYGTQIGSKSTWNMEIPKDDIDTIYALRRLSKYMGDVYVREPSGSGYWANILVSFSKKHRNLSIPITISITRVEGGI